MSLSHKVFRYLLILIEAVFVIALYASKSEAIELYSIIYSDCSAHTGLIVDVTDREIQLLNKIGFISILPRQGVENILIFNTVENPISMIELKDNPGAFPRIVTVQGNPDLSFTGWPIRFLEDLIVFYDIKGKSHLVNINQIKNFESFDKSQLISDISLQHTVYDFGFGNNMPQCSTIDLKTLSIIQPTRMLSDRISISKFLSVYQKGFSKLNRFESRTNFYARPYLYDERTKIGLIIRRNDYIAEIPQGIPFNFQWSTGSNFGPQGKVTLGTSEASTLPNIEPVFALQFSGKYHFLSLTYAGNLSAFSYGDSFLIKNRFYFFEFFSEYNPQQDLVFPQFNQVTLTGFDLGNYSISGGLYYPIIGVQGNNIFRELLSEESTPIVNLKYTTHHSHSEAILSRIRLKSDHPSNNNIKLIRSEELLNKVTLTSVSTELINYMDSFDLDSHFMRINYEMKLDNDLNFGISELYFGGNYQENFSNKNYHLKFNQLITSLKFKQVFGDYVSLKFHLNYFIRNYFSITTKGTKTTSDNKASFGVAIEFFL